MHLKEKLKKNTLMVTVTMHICNICVKHYELCTRKLQQTGTYYYDTPFIGCIHKLIQNASQIRVSLTGHPRAGKSEKIECISLSGAQSRSFLNFTLFIPNFFTPKIIYAKKRIFYAKYFFYAKTFSMPKNALFTPKMHFLR